jgi:hypothetical protein
MVERYFLAHVLPDHAPANNIPLVNVIALEASPQIGHLITLPFVIVRVEIGNAQHAIRLQDARQFF